MSHGVSIYFVWAIGEHYPIVKHVHYELPILGRSLSIRVRGRLTESGAKW